MSADTSPNEDGIDESVLNAALEAQAAKLLQTDRRSPLIQFERGTGRRIWLAGFPSLDWLLDSIPDADAAKKGLRITPHPSTQPGSQVAAVSRDPVGGTHASGSVFADTDRRLLDESLHKIAKAGRTFAQENGLDVIKLVTGFLEWRDPSTNKEDASPLWSPLLSTPISLRDDVMAKLDAPEDNATLRRKLHDEFRIKLPEIEEDESVDDYLDRITNWMKASDQKLPGAVLHRRAAIGILNFAALRLHRDLQHPAVRRNPHVRRVLAGPFKKFTRPEDIPYDSIVLEASGQPDPLPPLIYDADGTQHAALVEALVKKHSLVIEGPPGTGKSQTICNLIAAALADNKRVLFVSQKQAALDVVRRRLHDAGLGDFCLDLHGTGTTRSGFLDRVRRRLRLTPQLAPRTDSRPARDNAWRSLALPARALAEPVEPAGVSGFDAIWAAEAARARLGSVADRRLTIEAAASPLTDGEIERTYKQLAEAIEKASTCDLSPLQGLTLRPDIPKALVKGRLSRLEDAALTLANAAHQAANWLAQPPAVSTITLHQAQTIQDRLAAVSAIPECADLALCRQVLSDPGSTLLKDMETLCEALHPDAIGGNRGWIDQPIEDIQHIAKQLEGGTRTPEEARQAQAALIDLQEVLTAIAKATDIVLQTVDHLRQAPDRLRPPPRSSGTTPAWVAGLDMQLLADAAHNAAELHAHLTATSALSQILSRDVLALPGDQAIKHADTLTRLTENRISPMLTISRLPTDLRRKITRFATSDAVTLGQLIDSLKRHSDLAKQADRLRRVPLIREILKSDVIFGPSLSYELLFAKSLAKLPAAFLKVAVRADGDGLEVLHTLADQLAQRVAVVDRLGLLPDKGSARIPQPDPMEERRAQSFVRGLQSLGIDASMPLAIRRAKIHVVLKLATARDRLRSAGWCDQNPGLGDWDGWWVRANGALAVRYCIEELPLALRQRIIHILDQEEGTMLFQDLPKHYQDLTNALTQYLACKREVDAYVDFGSVGFAPPSRALFEIARHLGEIGSTSALLPWLDLESLRATLRDAGRAPLLRLLDSGVASASQLWDLDRLARWRPIAEAVLSRPAIAQFSGSTATALRAEFTKADLDVREETIARIVALLSQNIAQEGTETAKLAEMTDRILLETLTKAKKTRMPIRTIMRRARKALTDLFPCFMMSPLAVAQFLEPDGQRFDLLIIDEASQLTLQEGLGALARADQFVVVGDPHQLPPTSLFQRLDDDHLDASEDDTQANTIDVDSILVAAQGRYPTRRLLWHYRSRHESLIRFSNEKVYDNELLIFASASGAHCSRGVRMISVPNPRYLNQQNVPEALTVVELVARIAEGEMSKEDTSRRTLAVVAMNGKQADLIEDRLRSYKGRNTALSDYIQWAEDVRKEPFLIKNLENIQGDERDVVILSMTYGPNPNGRVLQFFGAISKSGGYRHLNVMITRARDQMLVVSSLRPEQISDRPSAAQDSGPREGRVILKRFLQYVESGGAYGGANAVGRGPESGFEEAVGIALDAADIPFDWQVGSVGARIDIAIRHPTHAGAYVLAVECDGERWHRSASRREADRLRQERLEANGWSFHRIWSSDWYSDPTRERTRLIAACTEAINNARTKELPSSSDPDIASCLHDKIAQLCKQEALDQYSADDTDQILVDQVDDPSDGQARLSAREGTEIVLYEDEDPTKERRMRLVRGRHDLNAGLLGLHTPLGSQLEDRLEGECFTVTLPKGKVRYRLAQVIDRADG
ncbi:MAG: DUF4011 domain-containing protein [Alphaproteobacteria bacterium]|nr:MAG: DUF4011 domain-containing protein [Alphaproteobacteria bacterium]